LEPNKTTVKKRGALPILHIPLYDSIVLSRDA
jgi:hypothetical protein